MPFIRHGVDFDVGKGETTPSHQRQYAVATTAKSQAMGMG